MKRYNVLDKFTAEVNVLANPYNFEQSQLLDIAMRINKKRSFLFVSKVLGKHLAVQPQIPIITGQLLAYRFLEVRENEYQKLTPQLVKAIKNHSYAQEVLQLVQKNPIYSKKKLRIIGFAETATALGHAFFDAFEGDVRYIHTTRECLVNVSPTLTFEEEHSHASMHRLYADETFFNDVAELVLVDDEMTTGNTNRNIIRQLHAHFPNIKVYTLVSILDWRSETSQQQMADLAQELNIEIHSVSLIQGEFLIEMHGELPVSEEISFLHEETEVEEHSIQSLIRSDFIMQPSFSEEARIDEAMFYKGSGRFPLTVEQHRAYYQGLQSVIDDIVRLRTGKRCLVLGVGEFMYTPLYIATQMGEGVSYHSTTRSPIFAHNDSLIHNKIQFKSPEFPGVTNYLYNISKGEYEDIFLIFERILDQDALSMLVSQLRLLTNHVHIITFGGDRNVDV